MNTSPSLETPMEYFIAKGYSYALQRNVKFKLGIDPEATPLESLIKAEATARDFLSKLYGLIGTITVVKSEAQK
ncbi:MAG: hypothetical protein ACI4KF_13510 [Huintestinicola sp.]